MAKTDILLTDLHPFVVIKATSKRSMSLFPHMFEGCKDETMINQDAFKMALDYFKGLGLSVSYNGTKIKY